MSKSASCANRARPRRRSVPLIALPGPRPDAAIATRRSRGRQLSGRTSATSRLLSLVVAGALGLSALLSAPGPAQAGGTLSALGASWRVETGAGPARQEARGDRSALKLLPGWRTGTGAAMAGLEIRLDPGWKTYWRVPGDAGIPPEFDWSGSDNVAHVEVRWPRPKAFDLYGMTTLGYAHQVVLPLEVTPIDPARPITLRVQAMYGVCADICMPEMAALALALPDDGGRSATGDAARAPIERALAQLPRDGARDGVRLSGCRLVEEGRERRLEAALHMPAALPAALGGPLHAVVESAGPFWFEPARIEPASAADGPLRLSARLDPASGAGWLDRGALRVTLLGEREAMDLRGCAP